MHGRGPAGRRRPAARRARRRRRRGAGRGRRAGSTAMRELAAAVEAALPALRGGASGAADAAAAALAALGRRDRRARRGPPAGRQRRGWPTRSAAARDGRRRGGGRGARRPRSARRRCAASWPRAGDAGRADACCCDAHAERDRLTGQADGARRRRWRRPTKEHGAAADGAGHGARRRRPAPRRRWRQARAAYQEAQTADRAAALRVHLRGGRRLPGVRAAGHRRCPPMPAGVGRRGRGGGRQGAREAADEAATRSWRERDTAARDAGPRPGPRPGPSTSSSPPGWPSWTTRLAGAPGAGRAAAASWTALAALQSAAGRRGRRGAGRARRRSAGRRPAADAAERAAAGGLARLRHGARRGGAGSARRRPTATTWPPPGPRWRRGRADAGGRAGRRAPRPTRRSPAAARAAVAASSDAARRAVHRAPGWPRPTGPTTPAPAGRGRRRSAAEAAHGSGSSSAASRPSGCASSAPRTSATARWPRRWPGTCGPTTSSAGCSRRRSTCWSTAPRGSCASCPAGSTTWSTTRASSSSSTTTTPGCGAGVRTLSGGETFQASLALALALSEQLAGMSTDVGQPGVDRAGRGLRHARRGHAGHGGGDAGEPGRPRRPDGRRGHPRAGAGRAGAGAVRGAARTPAPPAWNGSGCDAAVRRRVGSRRTAPPSRAATAPAGAEQRRRSTPTSSCRPTRGAPLDAPPAVRAPDVVLLVDGVRRIDAGLWTEEDGRHVVPGLAASYAAGVVRCDLRRGVGRAGRRAGRPRPVHRQPVAPRTWSPAQVRYAVHRVERHRRAEQAAGRGAAPADRAGDRGLRRRRAADGRPAGGRRAAAQPAAAAAHDRLRQDASASQYLPAALTAVVTALRAGPAHARSSCSARLGRLVLVPAAARRRAARRGPASCGWSARPT